MFIDHAFLYLKDRGDGQVGHPLTLPIERVSQAATEYTYAVLSE